MTGIVWNGVLILGVLGLITGLWLCWSMVKVAAEADKRAEEAYRRERGRR